MKLAAAEALAALVSDEERNEQYILPGVLDPRAAKAVAKAVAEEARKTGIARI
jgi:malate dehydrogenase (oxaloacetate-decarboxylating)